MFAALTGVVMLLDAAALVVVVSSRHEIARSARLRRSRLFLGCVGAVLAVASVTVRWPYGAQTRMLGLPMPAAVFELWGSGEERFWADFVGPLTLPLLVLDFVLCACLPQVVLALFLVRSSRRRYRRMGRLTAALVRDAGEPDQDPTP
jgi:hypothetical protein